MALEATGSGSTDGGVPGQGGQDERANCPFPECIFRGHVLARLVKQKADHHVQFKCPSATPTHPSADFGNIAPRSRVREANRLVTSAVPRPLAKYWCDLTLDEREWEKFVEENLTISRLANIIQKRSHSRITREDAITLAKDSIVALSEEKADEEAERAVARR